MPCAPAASGATDPMQIRLAHRRHIEIEDVRHPGDVETARGQIAAIMMRMAPLRMPSIACLRSSLSRLGTQVRNRQLVMGELRGDPFRDLVAMDEHDRARHLEGMQQLAQDVRLVPFFADQVQVLDVLVDRRGVRPEAPRASGDSVAITCSRLRFDRRRREDQLPARRREARRSSESIADVSSCSIRSASSTTIAADVRRLELAALDQLHDAPRRAHHDLRLALRASRSADRSACRRSAAPSGSRASRSARGRRIDGESGWPARASGATITT